MAATFVIFLAVVAGVKREGEWTQVPLFSEAKEANIGVLRDITFSREGTVRLSQALAS